MKKIVATVVSVHSGSNDDLSKEGHSSIQVELSGIQGDRHQSYERSTWDGDKQPKGTERRNERQWSAVSVQELADISAALALDETLTAERLGANLCISGVPELSRLPKGTLLKFSSGAELAVEEYNPPCHDMGKKLASIHTTKSGSTKRLPGWCGRRTKAASELTCRRCPGTRRHPERLRSDCTNRHAPIGPQILIFVNLGP